jgi:hypothetical protein
MSQDFSVTRSEPSERAVVSHYNFVTTQSELSWNSFCSLTGAIDNSRSIFMRRLIIAAGTVLALIGAASAQGSHQTAGSARPSGSTFVNVPKQGELSSNLIGLDVYNGKQNLGEIKDVALGKNGQVDAYILSVGGILGLGEHYVAVNPSDVSINYRSSNQKWYATLNATTAELKAAPEFKYTGRWNASKS